MLIKHRYTFSKPLMSRCDPCNRTPAKSRQPEQLQSVCAYFGMIVPVKSLGLRTRNARPCGSQLTMDMSSVPSTSSSISYNFSGKGCAVIMQSSDKEIQFESTNSVRQKEIDLGSRATNFAVFGNKRKKIQLNSQTPPVFLRT